MPKKPDSMYYRVEDVMRIMEVKERTAYKLISNLNQELKAMGKITIAGRIPKSYFHLRTDINVSELKKETDRAAKKEMSKVVKLVG